MNNHSTPRGNRARRDKDSILADTKNLLTVLYPAVQRMPKIDRIEGSPREMILAAQQIIRHFHIAKECQEVRLEHIREMIGCYGLIVSNFELTAFRGLLTDKTQLAIARHLATIEEGIIKWRNASRSVKRQIPSEVTAINPYDMTAEGVDSTIG